MRFPLGADEIRWLVVAVSAGIDIVPAEIDVVPAESLKRGDCFCRSTEQGCGRQAKRWR